MIIGAGAQGFLAEEKRNLESLAFGLAGRQIANADEKKTYAEMQSMIPSNERALVRLDKNYLLDFMRNEIFIADYPGGSSLPPGMPFFKADGTGPEEMSRYLLSHGIRYVAYSYKSEASFTRELYGNRLEPSMNAWIRSEASHTFDFQDTMAVLGETRQRVYDDGSIYLLDLRTLATNK
jgi:hypothetical protein